MKFGDWITAQLEKGTSEKEMINRTVAYRAEQTVHDHRVYVRARQLRRRMARASRKANRAR